MFEETFVFEYNPTKDEYDKNKDLIASLKGGDTIAIWELSFGRGAYHQKLIVDVELFTKLSETPGELEPYWEQPRWAAWTAKSNCVYKLQITFKI